MIVLRRLAHGVRELMRGESQDDAYPWAAVAAAHCWIGMGIWGGLAVMFDRWTAVWLAPLVYFVAVECVQLALAERRTVALLFDSILDTVAVTLGCMAGACTGDGNLNGAMAAWVASVLVITAGSCVRGRGVA